MLKHRTKRGDTLIEVMMAVGIFSMVAISVVAVMSSGTSSSQSALETTLAREEIDAQAEALRFIHRAYIADKNIGSAAQGYFGKLWQSIVAQASDVEPYHPQSCQGLYPVDSNAFILNIANLGVIHNEQTQQPQQPQYAQFHDLTNVLISARNNPRKFTLASTYPHLIYSANNGANGNNSTELVDREDNAASSSTMAIRNLYRAEGIYVLAASDGGSPTTFYDFYIRTCWYGAGEQVPSTISTVIRLYNPDINDT